MLWIMCLVSGASFSKPKINKDIFIYGFKIILVLMI